VVSPANCSIDCSQGMLLARRLSAIQVPESLLYPGRIAADIMATGAKVDFQLELGLGQIIVAKKGAICDVRRRRQANIARKIEIATAIKNGIASGLA